MSSPSPRQQLLADATSPEKTPFHYVIVGSGAGGGPLAARLVRGGRRVLLLEAGEDLGFSGMEDPSQANDRNQVPEVQEVPCYHAAATEDPKMTWSFSVRHFADDARQARDTKYNPEYDPAQRNGQGKGGIFYPRCAALGGCTAHHALIIVAPNDRDWNEIAKRTGDNSWRAERMQGYFARIEQCLYHSIYQGFFRRIFGDIYEVARRIVGWINPRAVWDPGGHGDRGWQPTSFINPDLVAKIEKGDQTFRKVLIDAAGSVLGQKGTLSILKSALLQLRLVQFLDPNDRNNRRDKPEGLAFIPIATDGRRRTGVREWLRKTEKEYPEHLVILTGVHATRILFEQTDGSGAPGAKGVEVAVGAHLYEASPLAKKGAGDAGDLEHRCYFARDEVIVCGGAFNTPQLLMLSGIGEVGHLKECGIEHLTGLDGRPLLPSICLPGVGLNLQDRYEIGVISDLKEEFSTLKGISFEPGDVNDPARAEWLRSGTGLYTTNGGTLAILKRSGVDQQREPDLFIFGAPASFRGYYWGWSKDLLHGKMRGTQDQRNLWSWVILKAYTRNNGGKVRLRTNSPFQVPEIVFASFSEGPDEWEKDVDALVEAVELVREINAYSKAAFASEIQPGKELANRSEALREWIQDEAWGHHACGTCRMGSDSWQADVTQLKDRCAVVDSQFKVHGVRNLRIVDASVFPTIPGYFLVTPVLMISEKAADTILADTQEYPDPLRIAEDAAIRARRQAADVEAHSCGHIGLALSGGGIRSATFCLGVLQALAAKDRFRLIDILSTVSGGGYIGGFLGRLFTRIPDDVADKAGRVQDILANLNSPEIHWLRSTANYIAGSGLVDLRQNLAVFWRNLFAVHLVIAALLMVLFGVLKWLGDRLPRPAGPFVPTFLGPHLSHWWWLVAALLVLAILPGSLGFWLAPRAGVKSPHPISSLLAWIVLLGAAVAVAAFPGGLVWSGLTVGVLVLAYLWQEAARWNLPPGTKPGQEAAVIRSKLTIGLGEAIFIFVGAAIWVVLDTLARDAASSGLSKLMAAIVMALAPFLPLLKMAADRLGLASGRSAGLLSKWTPAVIAFPLAAFLLFVADVLVLEAFRVGYRAGFLLVVTFLVFSLIMGRAFGFLNLSSLQAIYAARLTRTFLGASNPERIYGAGSSFSTEVDLSHPGDDLPFYDYHPEKNGGPLHLINVCVNETTDVRAQRDVRENKGLPMCVGPHGVSVGLRFHALWVEAQSAGRDKEQRAMVRLERSVAFEENKKAALRAIPASEDPSGFHVLGRRDGKPAAVEPLRLGQWIGISGAAVGTGEGHSTSLPLSLLYGLVNLRLGYWWNSGVGAGDRPGRFPKSLWGRIKSLPATLFRTQSMILAEWRSYFPGPSDRFWYLTDGGHFDVTGIYELVRRRLPLMVAIDAGEDPDYHFNDLARLTRLIRLDFGAEVQWLDPSAPRARGVRGWPAFGAAVPGWIGNWLDPERLGSREKITRKGSCHASLARISYADAPEQVSWLVLIKSSLTGDESVDVLQYSIEDGLFPNAPTTNQFFGDSEWESYRALGYHIGAKLFI